MFKAFIILLFVNIVIFIGCNTTENGLDEKEIPLPLEGNYLGTVYTYSDTSNIYFKINEPIYKYCDPFNKYCWQFDGTLSVFNYDETFIQGYYGYTNSDDDSLTFATSYYETTIISAKGLFTNDTIRGEILLVDLSFGDGIGMSLFGTFNSIKQQ